MLQKPDPRPPLWSVVLPVVGLLLLFAPATLTGHSLGIALVSAGLIGAVLSAVHHAEIVAHRTGEPFGTLVLALAVLDVFAQTWLSRMRERTQAVAVALAQRAQVQLYWQHDMRNLAQWVGLLAEEFGAATPEQLPRLAQRLQRQAPLLQARAHKLLAATEAPTQVPAEDEPPVQALDLLHNAAELAGLAIAIDMGPDDGSGLPPLVLESAQAQALERALDNIFSNLARDSGARHGGVPLRCECTVHEGALQARLHTPRLATPWPRRAFEPLKSPTGSGMGLYQARRSLRDAGGDLQASEEFQGVVFVLRVPLASSECATAEASRNLTVAGPDASAQ